ncbi:hypothetical protein BC332_27439 [Capsicum chinense]|nr:hypothetical protein BC332_27439 [Capsicum chinense]
MGTIQCGWISGRRYQRKLREIFKLSEASYSNALINCCCCVCDICQEYRELKTQGMDSYLAWKGNVEKWKREGVNCATNSYIFYDSLIN